MISKLPPHAQQAVGLITRAAFTTGLNRILLVAAIIALVSGVVSLAAIRSKDFAQQRAQPEPLAWRGSRPRRGPLSVDAKAWS